MQNFIVRNKEKTQNFIVTQQVVAAVALSTSKHPGQARMEVIADA